MTNFTIPQHQIDALSQINATNHADSGISDVRIMYLGINDGQGNILPSNDTNKRTVLAHELGKPPEVINLPDWPCIPLRNDPSLENLPVLVAYPPQTGQLTGKQRQIIGISRTQEGQDALSSSGVTPFESEHNQIAGITLNSQPANYGFFSPDIALSTSGGVPLWRRMVLNDIPTSITTGQPLLSGSTAPAYSALNLAGGSSIVTGILPVANGGTGAATLPAHALVVGNGTSAVNTLAPGANHNIPISNGTDFVSRALTSADLPAGTGTVTSVGLSTDATWLTVGSSPIMTNGTITLNKTTGQTANRFLATPNGSTGVVDLRAIVDADLPVTLAGHTLTNTNTITLKDSLFTLQDDADTTKQAQFELSGITTGTTRTLTVPNASGTIVLTNSTGQGYVMTSPTTTSDNTIAGSTGSSGEVLLTIKTTDDATNKNLLEFRSSTGTLLTEVDSVGQIHIGGPLSGGGNYDFSVQGSAGAIALKRTSSNEPFIQLLTTTTGSGGQLRGLDAGGLRFTDGGGSTEYARFDSSGNMLVGGTALTARLFVKGTANTRQLLVQANSTQTTKIFSVFSSGGSEISYIDSDFSGTLNVFNTTTSAISTALTLLHTLTTANAGANNIGVDLFMKIADSASAVGSGVNAFRLRSFLPNATDASYTSQTIFSVYDKSGGARDALQLYANGSRGIVYTYPGTQTTTLAAVGGSIFDDFADAGNSTTTETDTYTHSITGNTFATNGDTLEWDIYGTSAGSATATTQLKVYFGGTVVADTGAIAISTSDQWHIHIAVIRDSSTSVRIGVDIYFSGGVTFTASPFYATVTGLTLSSSQTFKVTATRAGIGAATNDIIAKLAKMKYLPAI